MPNIILTPMDMQRLSSRTRDEILKLVQEDLVPLEDLADLPKQADRPREQPVGEFPDIPMPVGYSAVCADIDFRQAKKFLETCSDKTKDVLRKIVTGEPVFQEKRDIEAALGNVRGVWGALTKRTQNVLRDKKAVLIDWRENFYDEDGEWTDSEGVISSVTRVSFRKAFGIN